MKGFVVGFLAAAGLAAGSYYFLLREAHDRPCADRCGEGTRCEAERCVGASPETVAAAEPEPRGRGRRRRPGGRRSAEEGSRTTSEAGEPTSTERDELPAWGGSDALDLPSQEVDMNSDSDGQLSNGQIESTMGRHWSAIRRCIAIAQVDRETPVRGRMSIGLRIHGTGEVAAVKVSPPGPLASTDLGPCVRSVVGRIRFPRFDGRDMVVTYPVALQ